MVCLVNNHIWVFTKCLGAAQCSSWRSCFWSITKSEAGTIHSSRPRYITNQSRLTRKQNFQPLLEKKYFAQWHFSEISIQFHIQEAKVVQLMAFNTRLLQLLLNHMLVIKVCMIGENFCSEINYQMDCSSVVIQAITLWTSDSDLRTTSSKGECKHVWSIIVVWVVTAKQRWVCCGEEGRNW